MSAAGPAAISLSYARSSEVGCGCGLRADVRAGSASPIRTRSSLLYCQRRGSTAAARTIRFRHVHDEYVRHDERQARGAGRSVPMCVAHWSAPNLGLRDGIDTHATGVVQSIGTLRRGGVGTVSCDRRRLAVRALFRMSSARHRRRFHDSPLCGHRLHRDVLILSGTSAHGSVGSRVTCVARASAST